MTRKKTRFILPLAALIGSVAGFGLASVADCSPLAPGLSIVTCAACGWILFWVAFRQTFRRVASAFSKKATLRRVDRLVLMLIGLAIGAVLVEAGLLIADHSGLRWSFDRGIPEEWARREVDVPGAQQAHYWHGILFVFDAHRMRRTTPFPPRKEGCCRIAVVGDSLTYGYGVEIEDTYASRLQEVLAMDYHAEVFNLGVNGHSSEDVHRTLAEFIPRLQPDVVIYGICLNDFLPSGAGVYKAPRFSLIPARTRQFLSSQTRLGALVRDTYENVLINLGIERDFYDDILAGDAQYRERFSRDVEEINNLVVEAGLPPVIALALDSFPVREGKGHRIARVAEHAALEAGMTAVPLDDYYRDHDGEDFSVSQWEGHPNAHAHSLFAGLLLPYLQGHPALEECTRGGSADIGDASREPDRPEEDLRR